MKQCQQCRQNFSDETYFCLSDGTPLSFVEDTPEQITIIRQKNVLPMVQPVASKKSPFFTCVLVSAILIFIGGGAILAGYLLLSKIPTGNSNSELTNSNPGNSLDKEKANLQRQQEEIEKERQKLAKERQKINEEKNKTTPTPISIPTATPFENYPPQPTARIKFEKGRVAETISGKIFTERSFVLEARGGQYLSATVNGGSCVKFSNGSNSIGYTTYQGDNRITIVNSCGSETSFSLTVSIK